MLLLEPLDGAVYGSDQLAAEARRGQSARSLALTNKLLLGAAADLVEADDVVEGVGDTTDRDRGR